MAYSSYSHVSYPRPMRTAAAHCREIAQFLHDNPRAWTQGVYARDALGSLTDPEGGAARSLCMMGLIMAHIPDLHTRSKVEESLQSVLNCISVPAWNDEPTRNVFEVEDAFLRAAKRCERVYAECAPCEQQQLDALVPFEKIMAQIVRDAVAA